MIFFLAEENSGVLVGQKSFVRRVTERVAI